MLVDYERAFLDLKARLIEKRSWGLRELMVLVAEVEQDSRLDADDFDPTPEVTREPAISSPVQDR
jgi:hypothetical protein